MVSTMAKRKRHTFFDNAIFLFAIVLVFWGIWAIDALIDGWSARDYGIRPGQKLGLLGIPVAPFLHANKTHLIGNTLPFLVLGGLTLFSGRKQFIFVSAGATLVSGIAIWFLADKGNTHLGASSLIFGYLGFLLVRACLSRDLRSGAIALLAGFLYGGILLTLLHNQAGISWHGHAFGLAGGAIAGWLLTGSKGRKARKAPVKL
jgi:membrane associated rhomboid family serine protease